MYKAGLVLEGGGMKGIFTAGVLDLLMDKNIMFSDIYGVSAGACHMTSYISGQRGRAFDISVDYLDTRWYCGIPSLLFTGNLFNTDIAYGLVPDALNPFDHDAYERYEGNAYSVVTDVETGEPGYLRMKSCLGKNMDKLRASASLPLVARMVEIGGRKYLDGGQIERVLCGGENYGGRRPCHYEWVRSLRAECLQRDITFCFLETGTVFVREGKQYTIADKQLQTRQAFRSGLNYEGKPLRFNLVDSWGMPIPEKELYVKQYCENCEECSMKLVCNGCSDCGKCSR